MSGAPQAENAKPSRKRYDLRIELRFLVLRMGLWLVKVSGGEPAVPYYPPESKLATGKRAEMDYKDQLSFWRLLWVKLLFGPFDKLVLGALVGLGVVGATLYLDKRKDDDAHALEAFKLAETQRQFLLGKRLDALNEVNITIGEVNGVYFDYTGVKKGDPEDQATKKYREAVANADKAIDKAEILFPPGFTLDMERYLQVHKKIMAVGVQKCGKYEDLMLDLYQRFGLICFDTIEAKKDVANWITHDQELMPLTFSAKERRSKTDQEYLDGQLDYWNKHQNDPQFKRRR